MQMDSDPDLAESTPKPRKKGSEVSVETRMRIIANLKAGMSYRQTNVELGAVQRTASRYKNHGTYKTLKRTGRPRSISEQTRRRIVREVKKNPGVMVKEISEQFGVSIRSVHEILRENGMQRCRAVP